MTHIRAWRVLAAAARRALPPADLPSPLRRALSVAIRRALREGRSYPVLAGPNRGRWLEYVPWLSPGVFVGTLEPGTAEVIRQVVAPGDAVLELGANAGYFTLLLDAAVGPHGRVLALEPVPATRALLERNLARNGCRRTEVLEAAASDRAGTASFFVPSNPHTASLLNDWAGPEAARIEVPTAVVDATLASRGLAPAFIKMDIEGGGAPALAGMTETIRRYRPVFLMESHSPAEDAAIGRLLTTGGYRGWRVGSRVPLRHLERDYRDLYGVWGPILAVPRERHAVLARLEPARFQAGGRSAP